MVNGEIRRPRNNKTHPRDSREAGRRSGCAAHVHTIGRKFRRAGAPRVRVAGRDCSVGRHSRESFILARSLRETTLAPALRRPDPPRRGVGGRGGGCPARYRNFTVYETKLVRAGVVRILSEFRNGARRGVLEKSGRLTVGGKNERQIECRERFLSRKTSLSRGITTAARERSARSRSVWLQSAPTPATNIRAFHHFYRAKILHFKAPLLFFITAAKFLCAVKSEVN